MQLEKPAPVTVGPVRLAAIIENSCKYGILLPSCLQYDKVHKSKGAPLAPTREKELRQGCSEGNPDACFGIGVHTMSTATMWNQKQKQAQAGAFLNKACSLGSPTACTLMLGLEMEGEKWPESVKSCCSSGSMDCCFLAWQSELMFNQNYEESFKYAKKACDSGACLSAVSPLSPHVAVASSFMGDPGFSVGVKPDLGKAVHYVKTGCEKCNDPSSCGMYGAILERGVFGQRRDKKYAADLYSRACADGSLPACAALFELNSKGMSTDWFQVAME